MEKEFSESIGFSYVNTDGVIGTLSEASHSLDSHDMEEFFKKILTLAGFIGVVSVDITFSGQ